MFDPVTWYPCRVQSKCRL